VSRNVSGQAYALTVLAPVVRGHVAELTAHLDALTDSPLARVPGTHFARWVMIGDRLLFTSSFDGPPAPYLEALRTGLGADADAIWSHCTGYPGVADAAGFAAWMRAHQVESALFYAAYGQQTVAVVKADLALRARLIDFALRTQRLPPDALKAAFQAERL
jgi:hypothetical protein